MQIDNNNNQCNDDSLETKILFIKEEFDSENEINIFTKKYESK